MQTLKHIVTGLLLLVSIGITAQQGINYKALVKDGSGNVVANQSITVQFQILQGGGMINVYQETHTPTTDANGFAIMNIGEGTVIGGVFATIDWGADDHYLNVHINTGGGLTDMGTIQFMAVPYALNVANESVKIDDLSDGKSDGDGSSLFLGKDAGLNDDGTDNQNVAVGLEALYNNTEGLHNTATGNLTLYSNTTGGFNSAHGRTALYSNTTGINNTANGYKALFTNTTGNNNTANGYKALNFNTTGNENTASGFDALNRNTTGYNNLANGFAALFENTTGYENTANGSLALRNNSTGYNNTATGYQALYNNTIGIENTAIGRDAGFNNSTGNTNIFIGYQSGFNELGSNKLYIENTNADSDNALIYGEFGSDNSATGNTLRTNSELQIGNPTGSGFAFPTTDGVASQILQTDGNGALTWQDSATSGPLAFGSINSAGLIESGSGNFSVVWNALSNWYEITITGESYVSANYSTLITPISGIPLFFSTASVNDDLIVILYHVDGTKVQGAFSFSTFK